MPAFGQVAAGKPRCVTGVELGEQERRRQEWDRQVLAAAGRRAGWAVFGLVLAAALAGLLGPGPLSWSSASGERVGIAYERFARRLGDTSLEVTVRPGPDAPGTARLWIAGDYLRELDVEQVTPQPGSWTATDGGVVLTFPVTGEEAEVSIRISPDHIGPLSGAVGVPGGEPARFWQFVYP